MTFIPPGLTAVKMRRCDARSQNRAQVVAGAMNSPLLSGSARLSYSTVASRETLAFPAWIAGERFTEAFSKPLRRINDDVALTDRR